MLIISLQNPTSVTDPTLDRSLIYIKDKNNNPVNLSYTENGAIVNVTKIDQLPKGTGAVRMGQKQNNGQQFAHQIQGRRI
ncbi:MAG: hypothetical protein QM749_14525 [Aquabacterium sp.]